MVAVIRDARYAPSTIESTVPLFLKNDEYENKIHYSIGSGRACTGRLPE